MKTLLKLALLFFVGTALGQAYPSKPIRILVAFPPGGPVDIIARLVGPKMSEILGQPVVVENKVGASGNVATAEVAKSAPDGYTLLTHSSAYAVNPTLFSNPGYDPVKDLLPIAIVAQQANIVLVNTSFPAQTLEELKSAMLKGKLAFGSPVSSAGTSGPAPLNGMWVASAFQCTWKRFTAVRWGVVPDPGEPKASLPLSIALFSSASVRAGNEVLTRMMFACCATIAIGSRSLIGS